MGEYICDRVRIFRQRLAIEIGDKYRGGARGAQQCLPFAHQHFNFRAQHCNFLRVLLVAHTPPRRFVVKVMMPQGFSQSQQSCL